MIDRFDKRKKDVLSKQDKSHKNELDEKISNLCSKINSLEGYYTTSSCSGRVVLMTEKERKDKNLFIAVYHDKLSIERLKEDLKKALKLNKNVKFKLEPCILHIACRSLENVQAIYDKAKLAGWKKSGIIGMKNGFTAELNGTERLEFPVIRGNKILVSDDFLKVVVEECNKKLESSWLKIKRLEKAL